MIKSRALAEFLVTVYGKNIDEISMDDIETISISNKGLNGEFCEFYPEDLLLFKNLKRINFDSAVLSVDDIKRIGNISTLQQISFKTCAFEEDKSLREFKNIKGLILHDTYIDDYSFLEEMEKLEILQIVTPPTEETINLELLHNANSLSMLVLDTCMVENFEALKDKPIEYLSLLMTKLQESDINFIRQLPNLKKLYINEEFGNLINRDNIEVKYNLIEETFAKEL